MAATIIDYSNYKKKFTKGFRIWNATEIRVDRGRDNACLACAFLVGVLEATGLSINDSKSKTARGHERARRRRCK